MDTSSHDLQRGDSFNGYVQENTMTALDPTNNADEQAWWLAAEERIAMAKEHEVLEAAAGTTIQRAWLYEREPSKRRLSILLDDGSVLVITGKFVIESVSEDDPNVSPEDTE